MDELKFQARIVKEVLTAIQRNCINNLQRANMHTGWLVLQQERTIYNCFVGADPDAIQPVANDNCTLITFSGKEWDIGEIVKAVLYWSDREMDKHG